MIFGFLIISPSFCVAAPNSGSDAVPTETNTTVSTSVRWNNENWFTTPHPEPDTFFVTPEREVFGTTTTGVPFSQINVPNEQGVRVQKFIMQDHYHYIVDSVVIYTEEELEQTITKEAAKANSLLARVASALSGE